MVTVLRVAAIYLFIMAGLRVMGKRDLTQLSPLELVTLLLIPELVTEALTGGDPSVTTGVVGVATVLALVFASSALAQRSKRAERIIEGEPTVLVYNGRPIEDNLNRERVTPGEVLSEAHKAGLERLEQVRWALLETDGRISIIPRDPADRAARGKPDEQDVL